MAASHVRFLNPRASLRPDMADARRTHRRTHQGMSLGYVVGRSESASEIDDALKTVKGFLRIYTTITPTPILLTRLERYLKRTCSLIPKSGLECPTLGVVA